jgi:hypothetical protein
MSSYCTVQSARLYCARCWVESCMQRYTTDSIQRRRTSGWSSGSRSTRQRRAAGSCVGAARLRENAFVLTRALRVGVESGCNRRWKIDRAGAESHAGKGRAASWVGPHSNQHLPQSSVINTYLLHQLGTYQIYLQTRARVGAPL